MSEQLEKLKKYITETPREQIDAVIRKVSALGIQGPTVDQYFNGMSGNPQMQQELLESKKRITDLERVLNDCRQDYLYLLSIKSVRSKRIGQIEKVLNIKE